ncbi:MAG: hypothetical protein WB615_15650 [Candidatus Tumulicola sp.]
MNAIVSIAGADAVERTRRFTFLLTIAVALYAGYLYVPNIHAGYATVTIHGHRGIYNSAYLGAAIALLTSSFLGLIGFYLVRGSVERDRELKVDGVVCASPVRRVIFLLGKFTSNLVVLCAIAGISFLAAMFMQELRGEDRHIDVFAYAIPFALISIPALAMVAAIAVAFDVVKPLRGILGGLLYVFIWTSFLAVPMTTTNGARLSPVDPLGMTTITASLGAAAQAAYPKDKNDDVTIGGGVVPKGGLSAYRFDGVRWAPTIVAQRLEWFALAILLVLVFATLFDRFSREGSAGQRSAFAFDLTRIIPNIPALRIVRAEFALLVNGASIWWLLGAVGLAVGTGVAPFDAVTRFILPIALIWPIERLSALGARERRWNVADILAATRGFAGRTLLIQWGAGTILGSLVCAGYIGRLAITGHPSAVLACVTVIAATTAAALALGTLSGASRFFEAGYLLVWYLGPINHLPALDFAASTMSAPLTLVTVCAVLLAIFLSLAALGRRAAALTS